MSRTYKDKPPKFRFPEEQWNYDRYEVDPDTYWYYWLQIPGVKTKKKRKVNTKWHWLGSTPSWWTYTFMIRPRRSKENQQLRNIKNIEEFDFVDVKRKNHKYYW